jgi:hypothetical protein
MLLKNSNLSSIYLYQKTYFKTRETTPLKSGDARLDQ